MSLTSIARCLAVLADPVTLHVLRTAATTSTLDELIARSAVPGCRDHVSALESVGVLTVVDGAITVRTTAIPTLMDLVLPEPTRPSGETGPRATLSDGAAVRATSPDAAEVRAQRADDWDAIRRIYRDGVDTGDATFETEVPSAAALDAKWLPGHRWVAEIAGEPVGWAAATAVSERSCYAGVAETSVYVADAARGRGVGSALVRAQIEAADAAGLWTLQTAIFPENRASIAIHRAAGFRVVGVRERIGVLHNRWRDTILLERRAPGP